MNNPFFIDEETTNLPHITKLIIVGAGIVIQQLDSIELVVL